MPCCRSHAVAQRGAVRCCDVIRPPAFAKQHLTTSTVVSASPSHSPQPRRNKSHHEAHHTARSACLSKQKGVKPGKMRDSLWSLLCLALLLPGLAPLVHAIAALLSCCAVASPVQAHVTRTAPLRENSAKMGVTDRNIIVSHAQSIARCRFWMYCVFAVGR